MSPNNEIGFHFHVFPKNKNRSEVEFRTENVKGRLHRDDPGGRYGRAHFTDTTPNNNNNNNNNNNRKEHKLWASDNAANGRQVQHFLVAISGASTRTSDVLFSRHDPSRVVPSCTEFYRVLPSFTEFSNRSSSRGFTGFYRVGPGWIGFAGVGIGFDRV